MRTVRTVAAMQKLALAWRQGAGRVALVPTMGYLHAGHLSLIHRARQAVGRAGKVVVSIYVNPTQFAPTEDLTRYPRDFARDLRLCREATVDTVFAPSDEQMYPGKATDDYSTYVVEERLSRGMEGASRPTHFRGVTTVVAKLFNIVQPQVAVFGAKDYQQAAIVRRMVRDLNFPLTVLVASTFREKDGLAMSSRNKYLEGDLRRQALVLSQALGSVKRLVKAARRPLRAFRLKSQVRTMVQVEPEARLDYVEFFHPHTLVPVTRVTRGHHVALAVFVGTTRLIDNIRL
jgi:pantoate--beta-alanine ligase